MVNSNLRVRRLDIFIYLTLFVGVFLVYRYGLISAPRGDYFGVMRERELVPSDWTFFWNAFSFTRTQIASHGDYFLFRPATCVFLALGELFFRHNLYALGLPSVFLHGLCTCAFYRLASKFAGRFISLVFSLLFLTQYAGMEMVFWRNISPYMLGVFFFIVGLSALVGDSQRRKKGVFIWAAVFFFFACLFHESLAAGLMLFAFFIALSRPFKPQTNSIRSLFWICLIASLLYVLWNLADFFWHASGTLMGADDRVNQLTLSNLLTNSLFVAGLFVTVFLAPFIVRLHFPGEILSRAVWDFSFLPKELFLGMGFLAVTLSGLACFFLLRRWRRFEDVGQLSALSLLLSYFWALVFVIAAGRVTLRDVGYLHNSTYCYYLSNFALMLMAVYWTGQLRESENISNRTKQLTFAAIGFVLIAQILFSCSALESLLSGRVGFDRQLAKSTLEIAGTFNRNKEYCYGGSLNGTYMDHVRDRLLYVQSCARRPATPLFLVTRDAGDAWLVRLKRDEGGGTPLAFPSPHFRETSDFRVVLREAKGVLEDVLPLPQTLMSEDAYDLSAFRVTIPVLLNGGILLGYQGPNHFLMFDVDQKQITLQDMRAGKATWPIRRGRVFPKRDRVRLSVVTTRDSIVLFLDEVSIVNLAGRWSLKGKIGFYDMSGKKMETLFSEVLLWQNWEGFSEDSVFEPLFRLSF